MDTALVRIFQTRIAKRVKGTPKSWKKERSKDEKGYIYKDPKSKGHTYIKVSKGDPNSSNPGQRVDNARVQIKSKSYDVNGNRVKLKSEESHIPLKDFKRFDLEKYK